MGTGAASYLNRARYTRPKTIKGYYRWVDTHLDSIKLVTEEEFKRSEDPLAVAMESDHTTAQTVLMCSLRTATGLDPEKIKKYFPNEAAYRAWIDEISHPNFMAEPIRQQYFAELSATRIALTPLDGFLVSNNLIVDLMIALDKYFAPNVYI
jgi:coproporphyrinogen III oxidase-like Fe-S oxidoreductase